MNPTGVNGASGRAPPQCYNCNGYGHLKRNCPAPPRQSTGNPYNNGGNRPLQNMMLKDAGSRSYLEVEIAGNKHLCLLDSGSDVTLIPASIARGRKLTHTTQKLFAAGGRKLPLMGTTRVTIKLGDQNLEVEALVSKHIQDIMLGIDWLTAHDVQWKFGEGSIRMNDQQYLLTTKDGPAECRRLVTMSDVGIPPKSEKLVPSEFKEADFGVSSGQLGDRTHAGQAESFRSGVSTSKGVPKFTSKIA